MDAGYPTVGVEMGCGDGVCEQLPSSGQDGRVMVRRVNVVSDSTAVNDGPNENAQDTSQLQDSGALECLAGKDGEGSNLLVEISGLTMSKDSEVADPIHTKHLKNDQGRSKIYKPSNTKSVAKNSVDGKGEIAAVPNGLVTSKQPFALATNRKTSNNRQGAESIVSGNSGRLTKLTSAPSKTRHSQQVEKSSTASPSMSTTESEGLKERAKHLKPLKQGAAANDESITRSASSSPTAGGNKPRRTGTLPSYDISFKCDERAEKRKEFYSKLEEKTYAKEQERTTLQAKSKETQETEIKMLRKSLNFKATPIPSFYRESAPPKVELKKIPPTRAKSPKLGRQKNSSMADSRPVRLSLGEKLNVTNGSSPHPIKKPARKSLPKLLSEKSKFPNATGDAATQTQHSVQKAGLSSDLSQSEMGIKAESVTEVEQTSPEQEPECKA